MKKTLTTLIAAAVCVSALPYSAVFASENYFPAETSEKIPCIISSASVNKMSSTYSVLDSIAASLGAETDYLCVQNYIHEDSFPLNDDCLSDFNQSLTNSEIASRTATEFYSSISGGMCMGISLIEILSHNGVIHPSDIQSGAKTLCEITKTPESDKIITDYQVTQLRSEQKLYETYPLYVNSPQELVKQLVDKAETNMENNRYFLITLIGKNITHAIAGIGITDGSWEFNGKDYDKCVLTLDSNVIDEEGNPVHFSDKSCIYINSQTNQAYIPGYDIGTEDDLLIGSFDDDTVLNSNGSINPSGSTITDLSSIYDITLNGIYCTDYTMTVTNADGSKFNGIDAQNDIVGMGTSRRRCYVSGAGVTIDGTYLEDSNTGSPGFSVLVKNIDSWFSVENDHDASVYFDNNKISLENKNVGYIDNYFLSINYNEGKYDFASKYSNWLVNGITDSDFTIEAADSGVILSGRHGVKAEFKIGETVLNEYGFAYFGNSDPVEFNINSAGSVMVSLNDENNPQLFIDTNEDNVFETPVEKGDANCDGKITPTDASILLQGYASRQTGGTSYINETICDYNGDSKITPTDASLILAYYAAKQTLGHL